MISIGGAFSAAVMAAAASALTALASFMKFSIPPPTNLRLVDSMVRMPPSLPWKGPRFSSISMTIGKYPFLISSGFSIPEDILKWGILV